MKKIFKISFPLLTFAVISLNSFAQKLLTEALVEYDISISSSKGDALSDQLNGAKLTLYSRPGISRTEMVSSLGTESTVFDNKTGKGFILKEYSGQKLMITMTRENWQQKNQRNDNLKFEIAGETVVINGYNCKKATALTADGKTLTVYFTPEITLANTQYNNAFKQLPGLPVQYELQSGNLSFKYSLKKVSDEPVETSKFDAPKSGYRIMSFEENQQLKKGK
ncbi:MAG: hypothetical protein WAT19_07505 [Ferruginibacter sp.]